MSSTYYETIQNPTTFQKISQSSNAQNFASLSGQIGLASVSSWGRKHLFACRVICHKPRSFLELLEPFIPSDKSIDSNSVLAGLISGPKEGISALSTLSEPAIAARYTPNSLGYVWAALGRTVSTSSKADKAHLAEDLAVRLVSSFVRCVLNYAQNPRASDAVAQFRDAKSSYKSKTTSGVIIRAFDDGGIELFRRGVSPSPLAMIKAKGSFQSSENGRSVVSDGVMAEMVGEVLASMAIDCQAGMANKNNQEHFTILIVSHYVKVFHFHVTDMAIASFQRLRLDQEPNVSKSYIHVHSTESWFDLTSPKGRRALIGHILALVAWSNA